MCMHVCLYIYIAYVYTHSIVLYRGSGSDFCPPVKGANQFGCSRWGPRDSQEGEGTCMSLGPKSQRAKNVASFLSLMIPTST